MNTVFWYDDINIIFNKDKLLEFIPQNNLTLEEKLNSIVRFGIYFSILMTLLKKDYRYMYVALLVMGVTYIVYLKYKETFKNKDEELKMEEKLNNLECDKPKDNNPLMNTLLTDDFKTKKQACTITKEISKDIDNKFYSKLYASGDNLYNGRIDQRQFYSMPNTQVPNNQGDFAKWLYSTPVSCESSKGSIALKQHRACNINYSNINEIAKFAENSATVE